MPPSIPGAKHLPGHPATVFGSTSQKWARLSPWAQQPYWTEPRTSWSQRDCSWHDRCQPYIRRPWSDEAWTDDATTDHHRTASASSWSDAPLRSLRADLGLVDPSGSASLVPRAAQSRTPPGLAAKLSGLEDMIKLLNETVSRHATELARAHIAAASSTAPTRYVQNTTSAAVHAVRANNDSQTVRLVVRTDMP